MNLPALMGGFDPDGPGLGFGFSYTFFRGFYSMVNTVPDKMGHRIGKFFQNGSIQFHIRSFKDKIHFFRDPSGNIPHHPFVFSQKINNRLHSHLHDGLLDIGRHHIEILHDSGCKAVFLCI